MRVDPTKVDNFDGETKNKIDDITKAVKPYYSVLLGRFTSSGRSVSRDVFGHICQVPSHQCLPLSVRSMYPRLPRVPVVCVLPVSLPYKRAAQGDHPIGAPGLRTRLTELPGHV